MRKEQKKETFPWKKVLVIAVGVLFVFMMVLSAMGSSWIQSFRTVMVNDSVTIDLTLRDARGIPVLTTDENIYRNGLLSGGMPFLTSPVTLQAGYIGNPAITGLPAENYFIARSGQVPRFGILGLELDELDTGVLAMKNGETRTIRLDITDPLTITLMDYEFSAMGGNFTTIGEGDLIPLGISSSPTVSGLGENDEKPDDTAWRVGTVINKTADSLEVLHFYPTADITVRSIR